MTVPEKLLQLKTRVEEDLGANAVAAAERGVQGGGSLLPFGDQVQESFGRHDISGVRAHVGGAAGEAATSIGAVAYATGNDVAFARQPDLFTVAHEAAHVVQQRSGIQLKGGVGQSGDLFEQHADRVAEKVVRGESAEPVLDLLSGSGASQGAAVQRKEGGPNEQSEFAGLVVGAAGGAVLMIHERVASDKEKATAVARAQSLGAAAAVMQGAEGFSVWSLLSLGDEPTVHLADVDHGPTFGGSTSLKDTPGVPLVALITADGYVLEPQAGAAGMAIRDPSRGDAATFVAGHVQAHGVGLANLETDAQRLAAFEAAMRDVALLALEMSATETTQMQQQLSSGLSPEQADSLSRTANTLAVLDQAIALTQARIPFFYQLADNETLRGAATLAGPLTDNVGGRMLDAATRAREQMPVAKLLRALQARRLRVLSAFPGLARVEDIRMFAAQTPGAQQAILSASMDGVTGEGGGIAEMRTATLHGLDLWTFPGLVEITLQALGVTNGDTYLLVRKQLKTKAEDAARERGLRMVLQIGLSVLAGLVGGGVGAVLAVAAVAADVANFSQTVDDYLLQRASTHTHADPSLAMASGEGPSEMGLFWELLATVAGGVADMAEVLARLNTAADAASAGTKADTGGDAAGRNSENAEADSHSATVSFSPETHPVRHVEDEPRLFIPDNVTDKKRLENVLNRPVDTSAEGAADFDKLAAELDELGYLLKTDADGYPYVEFRPYFKQAGAPQLYYDVDTNTLKIGNVAGGTNRISKPGVLRRQLVKQFEKENPGLDAADYQAHHLIPDEVARHSKLIQVAIDRGIFNIDQLNNGIMLPNRKGVANSTKRGATDADGTPVLDEHGKPIVEQLTDLPVHRTSHPEFNKRARDTLDDIERDLIGPVSKDELDAAVEALSNQQIRAAIDEAQEILLEHIQSPGSKRKDGDRAGEMAGLGGTSVTVG